MPAASKPKPPIPEISTAGLSLETPSLADFAEAAELCFRAKAFWGYDAAFMKQCRSVLILDQQLVAQGLAKLARLDGRIRGVAEISIENDIADLELLFVDPEVMGLGIGAVLYRWGLTEAARRQCKSMTILADPGARGFYERQGAEFLRLTPSDAIAGRELPFLIHRLTETHEP